MPRYRPGACSSRVTSNCVIVKIINIHERRIKMDARVYLSRAFTREKLAAADKRNSSSSIFARDANAMMNCLSRTSVELAGVVSPSVLFNRGVPLTQH